MKGFVVQLSDGTEFKESPGLFNWLNLKDFLDNNKHLRIAKMYLQFDDQQVHLPNYAKVYFYSKKAEAYFGSIGSQKQYYGIGASTTTPDMVTITWYDGKNGKEEKRKVKIDSAAFIIAP